MKHVTSEYRKPAYSLDSVDNVLRTIHLLRDFGSTRVSDVATILGVADSTAHRIMAMLVYHGFAVQDDHRRYCAGPALYTPVISSDRTREVEEKAKPTIERLVTELGESVSLCTRVGAHTRVLLSLAPVDTDHVPERTGNVLLAHVSAAGRALLALLPDAHIERLYQSNAAETRGTYLSERDYAVLREELEATRRRGYARCVDAINKGISAIGVSVTPASTPPLAIVVSTPTARLADLYRDRDRMRVLFEASVELTTVLASSPVEVDAATDLIA